MKSKDKTFDLISLCSTILIAYLSIETVSGTISYFLNPKDRSNLALLVVFVVVFSVSVVGIYAALQLRKRKPWARKQVTHVILAFTFLHLLSMTVAYFMGNNLRSQLVQLHSMAPADADKKPMPIEEFDRSRRSSNLKMVAWFTLENIPLIFVIGLINLKRFDDEFNETGAGVEV